MNKNNWINPIPSVVIGTDIYEKGFDFIDKRSILPFIAENDGKDYIVQEMVEIKTDTQKMEYAKPNIISIYIEYSKKQNIESTNAFSSAIIKCDNNGIDSIKKISNHLYDYYAIKSSEIIFSYTALEAFINLSIPSNYKYYRKDSKKTEVYDKNQIERYISTKEKLCKIIAEIYKVPNFNDCHFYKNICDLEEIRNDLIHMKSIYHQAIYQGLLDVKEVCFCDSVIALIKYLHKHVIEKNIINECIEYWPQYENVYLFKKCQKLTKRDLT